MKYEIVKSKNNLDILKIDGIHIHSVFNPENEAAKIKYEGKNIIAVFGIGLGYHLNNIAANNPGSILIVYDPFDEIRELFINQYFNEKIFEHISIHFLKKVEEEKIFELLDDAESISEGRFYFYSNPGYKRLFPELEKFFFESIKKNIELLTQNIMTESAFFYMWTRNFIYNSAHFDHCPLINFKSRDLGENLAVIVCAGPSLDYEMESIKNARKNITVFAVDTAIKPLLKNGISPDFVISLDGQIHSLDDFTEDENENTCYIFDVVAYPQAARLVKNKIFSMTENIYDGSIMELFCRWNDIKPDGINSGGTVADYALDIARRFGFKNIYFSGLDLSFPEKRTHCKSSPFYDRTLYSSDYENSIETINIKTIAARKIKMSSGKSAGEKILTDFVLENYAFYINRYREAFPEVRIFNSRQKGLKIYNLQEVDLYELTGKLKTERIPCHEITALCEKLNVTRNNLMEFYGKTADSFFETSKILKELVEKKDYDTDNGMKILKKMFETYPLFERIIRFSGLSINKKNKDGNAASYERNAAFVLLQASYFFIRTLQKAMKKKH